MSDIASKIISLGVIKETQRLKARIGLDVPWSSFINKLNPLGSTFADPLLC